MFEVNCLSGEKRRVVKARITVDLQFLVGGTDDEDREDSVREALNDHYDDMVDQSFWRDAIVNMDIESVKTAQETEKTAETEMHRQEKEE